LNRQRIDVEWRKRPGCAWFDCGGIRENCDGRRCRNVGGVFEFGSLRIDLYLPGAFWLGDGLSRLIWRYLDWRHPA
jgi:hypothetical protein